MSAQVLKYLYQEFVWTFKEAQTSTFFFGSSSRVVYCYHTYSNTPISSTLYKKKKQNHFKSSHLSRDDFENKQSVSFIKQDVHQPFPIHLRALWGRGSYRRGDEVPYLGGPCEWETRMSLLRLCCAPAATCGTCSEGPSTLSNA